MVPGTITYPEVDTIFITERQQSFHFEYRWIIYIVFRMLCFGKMIQFNYAKLYKHCYIIIQLRLRIYLFTAGKYISILFYRHVISSVLKEQQYLR